MSLMLPGSRDVEHQRGHLEKDLVGIKSTLNILSKSGVNSGLGEDELSSLNKLTDRFFSRSGLSVEEARELLELRDRVGSLSDSILESNKEFNVSLVDIVAEYQRVLNDDRISNPLRKEAMSELSKMLKNVDPKMRRVSYKDIPTINKRIKSATDQIKDIKIDYRSSNNIADIVVSTRKERKDTDEHKTEEGSLRELFLKSPSKISVGEVRKEAIKHIFDSSGLGDLDDLLNISGRLDSVVGHVGKRIYSKIVSNGDPEDSTPTISNPETESVVPSMDNHHESGDVESLGNKIENSDDRLADTMDKMYQSSQYQSTLLERILSQLSNQSEKSGTVDDKDDDKDQESLIDKAIDLLGGDGTGKRKRRGKKGRIGKFLSRIKTGGKGILSKGAALAESSLPMLGKAAKIGGSVAALGMVGYDTYQGFDKNEAKRLVGDDSVLGRISSAGDHVLSGMTLGIASPEDIAEVADKVGKSIGSAAFTAVDSVSKVVKGVSDDIDSVAKTASDVQTWFVDQVDSTKKWMTDGVESLTRSTADTIDSISKTADDLGSEVSKFASDDILKPLTDNLKETGDGFKSMFDYLSDIPGIGDFFRGITHKAGKVVSAVGGAISSAGGMVIDSGATTVDSLRHAAANILPSSKEQDQRGKDLYNYAKSQGLKGDELSLFMGQVGHESGNFKYTEELASGKAYEGRADLGNTEVGDGERFKGRGYIQLTGRANYDKYGKMLGVDLVNHPELAEDPKISQQLAVAYWKDRVQPQMEKKGKSVEVATRAVNGGFNGLDDRKTQTAYWAKYDREHGDSDTGTAEANQPSIPVPSKQQIASAGRVPTYLDPNSSSKPTTTAASPTTVLADSQLTPDDSIHDVGLSVLNQMVLS